MYCQMKNEPDHCTDLNDTLRVGEYGLEQMFADNGVDIAFWGHIHLYQRSFPVLDQQYKTYPKDLYTNPKWPVHIITGKFHMSISLKVERVFF